MQVHPKASTSRIPATLAGDDRDGSSAPPLSTKAAGKARAIEHDVDEDDDYAKKQRKPQSFETYFKSGVAGGLAACVAKTSVGKLCMTGGNLRHILLAARGEDTDIYCCSPTG